MPTLLRTLLLPKDITGVFEAQKHAVAPRNNMVLSDLVSKHQHLLGTPCVSPPLDPHLLPPPLFQYSLKEVHLKKKKKKELARGNLILDYFLKALPHLT